MTKLDRVLLVFFIMLIMVGALPVSSARAEAQPNNPTCYYLDTHPGVAGVEDVLAMVIVNTGMDPYVAGETLYRIVSNDCPRHLFTLQEFVNKWSGSSNESDIREKRIYA